ncbi:MAG: TlpA family protein disulfide reductase [Luteibaculum sp.]
MKLTFQTLAVFIILLFSGIVLGVSWYSEGKVKEQSEERADLNALETAIEELEPHEVFNEDLQGQIVVINLWGGWCKPCLAEIPELNELVAEFSNSAVQFIAISNSSEEDDMAALEERDLEFNYRKLFLAPKESKFWQDLALDHERMGYPLNIILDRDGKIRFYKVGYSQDNVDKMREILEDLI